jgi:lysophospholipase L1-like esterase
MRRLRSTLTIVVAVIAVAGCAVSKPAATFAPTATATFAPTATSAPAGPMVTPTPAPTPADDATLPPPPAPGAMSATATFAPSAGTPSATWDLVALGDSNVAGWGIREDQPYTPAEAFPGVYGQQLAEQQAVEVVLHSYYPDQLGNEVRTVAEWADVVRTDPSMRSDLAEAEIVILLIGFHDLLPAVMFGSCPSRWPAFGQCVGKLTEPMPAAFDTLYGEVADLLPDGATVLVNDYGIPGPIYDAWSDDPHWDEIRAVLFEDWRDALEAAATKHGFKVVPTYAAMNDPGGRPKAPSEQVTTDGWHFNAAGHRIIADIVLAEDGLPD